VANLPKKKKGLQLLWQTFPKKRRGYNFCGKLSQKKEGAATFVASFPKKKKGLQLLWQAFGKSDH